MDASRDGDVIRVAHGTFRGGVTIDKSVEIVGAGAVRTTIRGGGPVLTIGRFFAPSQPTVTIRRVSITGGRTHTSPESVPFVGVDGVIALGGGIAVPLGADGAPGATLTIRRSVISGNRVAPTARVPSGLPCGDVCPFALARGGGIDTAGDLTLWHTAVIGNEAAGAPASDVIGGGIRSTSGALTISHSLVRGNQARATGRRGRFAEGGGLFVGGGSLDLRASDVSENRAVLATREPISAGGEIVEMNANSAGAHVSDGVPTTVDRVTLSHNAVVSRDERGEPVAFDSAMFVGQSPVRMRDVSVTGNTIRSRVATSADSGPGGGAFEVEGGGVLGRIRIVGNSSTVSAAGDAGVTGALTVLQGGGEPLLATFHDGVVSDNVAVASSDTGQAAVQGAGVTNGNRIALERVVVAGNRGTARGPGGTAQGGGIWNSEAISGPAVELTLRSATIVGNVLTRRAGIVRQGGGLYTELPVTRRETLITGNTPDDCFGCLAPARTGDATARWPLSRSRGAPRRWPRR